MGSVIGSAARELGCITERGNINMMQCGAVAVGASLGGMTAVYIIQTVDDIMDGPGEDIEYDGHELDEN